MQPGARGDPGGVSSSPVVMTATEGRRVTSTVVFPREASIPITGGVTSVPDRKSDWPGTTSLPAGRMFCPTRGARLNTMVSSDSCSVHSSGTTASAPSGMGAPVRIWMQTPGVTASRGQVPARTAPAVRSREGIVCKSSVRTANPSMPELSKGGIFRSPMTASARVRPRDSGKPAFSDGRGATASSTMERASSTEMNVFMRGYVRVR